MLKRTLKTALLVSIAIAGAASAQVTPCSLCEVRLSQCLQNGVLTPAQCQNIYEKCKAEACTAV